MIIQQIAVFALAAYIIQLMIILLFLLNPSVYKTKADLYFRMIPFYWIWQILEVFIDNFKSLK